MIFLLIKNENSEERPKKKIYQIKYNLESFLALSKSVTFNVKYWKDLFDILQNIREFSDCNYFLADISL